MDTNIIDLLIGGYLLYYVIKGSGRAYESPNMSKEVSKAITPKLRIIYAVCAFLVFLRMGLQYIPALADHMGLIGVIVTVLILGLLVFAVVITKKAEKEQ